MELNWWEDENLIAAYVLWVAVGGPASTYKQPGGYAEALVRAAFRADRQQRAILAMAYPVIVKTVMMYKDQEDGVLELEKRARLDS